ncbi:bifunctional ADP-dependent NAD(P)H-hydrate dehydratase/NAD(P)H-hydrate epimerase [Nocardia panacis]|uniref:ADP-dependent (S)-NAD(P)H-hydrate dehydratase n=1 Tax=Nocardia panacis TaxID=2340916 RepID=A0A3A4L0P5_9NOCA|nr:bifunctional ADP-dependent NAD(P)H-hydrate dehydratase/NAD(P)H-hydrate epimerase [Nocardia panacis]
MHAHSSADVLAAVAEELDRGGRRDRLLRKAAGGLAFILADYLVDHCGSAYGRHVTLLVGSGHNGADALLAGIQLRRRGIKVDAVLTASTAYEPGVSRLEAAGGQIISADTAEALESLSRADLVVDGIVGENGRGGLRGRTAELVSAIPPEVPVVAVDLPSGVEPDSGEIRGIHVRASLTVTFAAPKPCLLLPPGCHAAGDLRLVDEGLPTVSGTPRVRRLGDRDVAALWPIPERTAHKYLRGVLGVVAGADRYPGAAVLAMLGAVKSGAAGITRYIGPEAVTAQVLSAVPEAVPGIGQVQAWLLGSGVDNDEDQDKAIDTALRSGLPCAVDAGALKACVRRRLDGERAADAGKILLTPHAGELARILGWMGQRVDRSDIESRPMYYGRIVARELDATVLVKGPTTIIVGPEGVIASQAEAPPWLATAGAGDVLAGIAGALMASGLEALDAGEVAAFVHGRAAMRAHIDNDNGPITASEVAAAVPATIGKVLGAARFRRSVST